MLAEKNLRRPWRRWNWRHFVFIHARFACRVISCVGSGEDISYLVDRLICLAGSSHDGLCEGPKVVASADSCID
jgi:hypothetical protein